MNRKINLGLVTLGLATAVIVIGIVLVFLFLNPIAQKTNSEKIIITTSFYPLYFFTQQIAGDKADITNITPAGAEPHDYEPTAQDIAKIESSQILVLVGPDLEPWGNNIKQNIDQQKTLVVITGDQLMTQIVAEGGENIVDPHIWLRPPLAKVIADKITAGLIQVDPINKDYYQANNNELKLKLDNLDNMYKQGLLNCMKKDIITSHAAFGYMATSYGLNQVPISGLSPNEEPSPKQLADIANFAESHDVKYIFFEALVNQKLSQTIATEVGAQTLVLNPLEGLTKDEVSQGQDYFTVMKSNLDNLKIALECST